MFLVGVTPVAAPYLIRFVICCVKDINGLYSVDAIHTTGNIVFASILIHDAIHSHPAIQPIANLIQYGVATGFTPTYTTTNTSNKLLSHQFMCNIPCNKIAETSFFFCRLIVHTTTSCFVSKYFKY